MTPRAALISPDQIDAKESFDKCLARAMGLPPPHVRLVDRLQPRERQRPMKLLCLGFSRTGTYSLYLALTSLGYKPYHMAEVMGNPAVELPVWIDALKAKYDGRDWDKQQWSAEDFDKILAGYDCIMDIPVIMFPDELLKAYPDAKVILTERPVESWLKSLASSLSLVHGWPTWHLVSWADQINVQPWHDFVLYIDTIVGFSRVGRKDEVLLRNYYEKHYDHVRAICPPERLLEFKLGMGWDELCPFLDVEKPAYEYPRINDSAMFVEMQSQRYWGAASMAVQKLAAPVFLAALCGALAFRFHNGLPFAR